MEDISFMYNASVPVGDALELYSFGSYFDRNGDYWYFDSTGTCLPSSMLYFFKK